MGSLSSQDVFSTGGWWHDVRILSATGEGLEKEEPRAWEGWWNEHIVELARLSAQEPGALSVLLTGRAERGFGDLVQRIAKSKGLTFDMITLKPAAGPSNEKFATTMAFKQAFLEAVMETYAGATEIRIYEDRPRHVEGFRAFLQSYNERRQNRSQPAPLPAIAGEVIPVAPLATTLDPVIEVAEVQHMVNCHNVAGGGRRGRLVLTKTVFFTGYLIKEADSERLLGLLQIPSNVHRRDLKYHGNSIMISPRHCPAHVLAKAGGMGTKMTWRVEAMGSLDNSLWAVKVRPAVPNTTYHTAESVPLVVLAVCRGARPHDASRIRKWQPVAAEQVFEFETTVGEKAILRVESEHMGSSHDNYIMGREESDSQNSGHVPPGKRARVGPAPYNNGSSFRGRGGGVAPAGFSQTHGFAPPTGPRGGAGRGYYTNNQGGGRGGRGNSSGGPFRGNGYGGRGSFRGGVAARGGGRGGSGAGAGAGANGAGAGAGGAAGVAAGNNNAGRPRNGYYQYQSLDDAGPAQQPSQAQSIQRQQIVYDEE